MPCMNCEQVVQILKKASEDIEEEKSNSKYDSVNADMVKTRKAMAFEEIREVFNSKL